MTYKPSAMFFEDAVVGLVGKSEVTEVALMSFGPVGLAVVVVSQAAKEGEESRFGAAKIVDGIGAGAAKIANSFVNAVRNIDGDEVVGAEIFGELHGIAFICFDAVAGLGGDKRGRDDVTTNAHLKESPGDPKSASARFVANVKIGEFAILALGDSTHRSLQSVLGGGDGTVVTRFGIAVTFENGDDSFCFMNVESDVERLRCA